MKRDSQRIGLDVVAAIAVMVCLAPFMMMGQASQLQIGGNGGNARGETWDSRAERARQLPVFVRHDHKRVAKDQEEAYLAVESEWLKIHRERCRRGEMLFWGLMKADDPNEGESNYVTVQGFGSLDDLMRWASGQLEPVSVEGGIASLMERTTGTHQNVRSETYQVLASEWGRPHEGNSVDSISIGYMTPRTGKRREYAESELKVARPVWREMIGLEPSLKGWSLQRVLMSEGQGGGHEFITIHFRDRHAPKPELNQMKRFRAASKQAGVGMGSVKWGQLRRMAGRSFRLVLKTGEAVDPVKREWDKLVGVWKAENPGGGYRIKRIAPFEETLEIYNRDGERLSKATFPMKVEVHGGMNHFYSLHPQGDYYSVYKIHEGKWYEQLRGIQRNQGGRPNGFIVYERIEKD